MHEIISAQEQLRLDSIQLTGFKSFVDSTLVAFPAEFTTVVGPNGCGKSNVIDAVRWVMGESSAKHLRGAQMSDVIFNGAASRKPAGQASIELTFNNPNGAIGGEYAAYNKLAIRRTVTREGQSQYFINGTRCRRKDIADIFLGTGLGPRSYAIIEQGTVSRLIEAKPEEFRLYLEEAAGITQYNERRKETETRIRHTQDNLSRLQDLQSELTHRLQQLEKQAQAAEKYKVYQKEAHELKAELIVLRSHKLSQKWQQQIIAVEKQETQLNDHLDKQEQLEKTKEILRDQVEEKRNDRDELQANYYEIKSEYVGLEQQLNQAKNQRQQLNQQQREAEQAWQDFIARMENDHQRVDELKETIHLQGKEVATLEAEKLATETALQIAQENFQDWQTTWDDFKTQFSSVEKTKEIQGMKVSHLEQQLTTSEQQQARWYEEQKRLETLQTHPAIPTLQQTITKHTAAITTLKQRNAILTDLLREQRQGYQALNQQIDKHRKALQETRVKHAALTGVQQAALGGKNEQTFNWLKTHGFAKMPRLVEALEVETGWERAVEMVLSYFLQAVCIENLDQLTPSLENLPAGELNFFITELPALALPSRDLGEGRLMGKVKTTYPIATLLSSVYIAKDWSQVLQLLPELAPDESLIMAEGIWLSTHWVRTSKPQNDQEGIIEREKIIKTLMKTMVDHETQLASLEQQAQESRSEIQQSEEESTRNQQTLWDLEKELTHSKTQLTLHEQKCEEVKVQLTKLIQQINQGNENLISQRNALEMSKKEYEAAIHQLKSGEQQQQVLTQQRVDKQSELTEKKNNAQQAQQRWQNILLQWQNRQAQLTSIEETIQRLGPQKEALMKRKTQLNHAYEESEKPIETIEQALMVALEKKNEAQEGLVTLQQSLDHVIELLKDKEQTYNELVGLINKSRDQLNLAQSKAQETKIRQETYQEQLTELNENYEEVFNRIPENAMVDDWQKRLTQVENKVQRLGVINLAAIEEYAEQLERKTYLDEQQEDLMNALKTLDLAMEKIDQDTRKRFKSTFEQVNKNFQALFPSVFGGGQAYLMLTENNLLTTGVSVMAQPPGKKNVSIQSLSGGEKAMTAMALVFSIFQLNPAPFCMLDEVDAPLDDANVERFVKLIAKMATSVQFIVISHNKITMEAAKHLVGVTMGEPGVSRLVSVDIQQAMHLAEA